MILKIIKKKKNIEKIKKNKNVLLSWSSIFNLDIGNNIIPPTSKILAILLPIKLPATIPSDLNCNAWNVAANSGSDVPIAIMKIPTNISRILYFWAIAIEFLIA